MPTLYTQAEKNVKKTWLLMTTFLVLLIFLGWLFSYLLNNYAILIIAVIISLLINFSSYWYSDKIVLKMAKAKPIEKKDFPELFRIVENLSITAGLPTPKIFVMSEQQPNAFTTGRDASHAIIVVTQGLLDKLKRKELEGVIAHEISHIGNKDILLGTVIVILVGFIALLSNWFLRISFWGSARRRDNDSQFGTLIFFLGILAAILAPIAAQLIQLAISRKREFLADANGALLTRYPEGLAQALKKIAEDKTSLRNVNISTAHLYIESPFKSKQKKNWFVKLFMTHPPVEERIKALLSMNLQSK